MAVKKYKVRLADTAQGDVEEIWSYIAADNPDAADAFVEALDAQIASLETYPERCPLIGENELLGTRYRHLIYREYRTIFRVGGRTVFILRIIHGARLLDVSMFGTG